MTAGGISAGRASVKLLTSVVHWIWTGAPIRHLDAVVLLAPFRYLRILNDMLRHFIDRPFQELISDNYPDHPDDERL